MVTTKGKQIDFVTFQGDQLNHYFYVEDNKKNKIKSLIDVKVS